jgi:hypothetical protein
VELWRPASSLEPRRGDQERARRLGEVVRGRWRAPPPRSGGAGPEFEPPRRGATTQETGPTDPPTAGRRSHAEVGTRE